MGGKAIAKGAAALLGGAAVMAVVEALTPTMMGNGELTPEMRAAGLFSQLELSGTNETNSEQKLYLFRIGGGKASNLKLSKTERTLLPPGKSMLIGHDAQSVAAQFREVTGNNNFSVTGQISLSDVRRAGFNAISDPTRNFVNHARLTHPSGELGFDNLATRQTLSSYFQNIPTP